MKPIIALTMDAETAQPKEGKGGNLIVDRLYPQAIADAGGVPILVPPSADPGEIAAFVHGWLIPGGDDIDAAVYGEENHPQADLQDSRRFDFEAAFYPLLPPTMPILGICYGCQLVNVLRGGNLIQHLPDELGHDEHHDGQWTRSHIDPASKLGRLTGPEISGRCYHHQAIGRLGSDLVVTGRSEDGVIEAIEATDRPWLIAVQWHPERSRSLDPNDRLIREFVDAARRYAQDSV